MQLLGESGEYDIIITELGGTVGDIESLPFIEAVRQLRWELGNNDSLVIHLTLVPYLAAAGELKTKPTQHSVKTLLEYGVQPDILVCRTEHKLNQDIRKKLALFCNVNINAVVESIDASTIYEVPLHMLKEQLDKTVLTKLKLSTKNEPDLTNWKAFLGRLKNPTTEVNIGLVGKYVELPDAYKSISEAFIHAGSTNETKVKVKFIAAESIKEANVAEKLKGLDGVLVAPGFGERGLEGKLETIRYVRENKIPFFGICLGMQCSVIEFGRNVLGLKKANSYEMDEKTAHPVINLMEEQKNITNMGGTMRLGSYDCEIKKGTKAYAIYGKAKIAERHRHRYEFNNEYLKDYEKAGMIASGFNPKSGLVEIVELKDHPFFIASQFHPELKSTVANPHPLFVHFVAAALANKQTIAK
jgi:CTP synthase